MKHIYLLIAGMLVAYLPLNAQISEGGEPLSKKIDLSLESIEQAQLATFNLAQVMAEDTEDEKAGNYPKIGRVRPLDINLNAVDSWTEVKGGKLWRMALKSRDAKGLSVQFEDFNLPAGGKLFIYSPDYKHVIGAFTDFNNHDSGVFSTELIPGDEVIVEYFEPTSTEGLGQFKIASLVHAYRMVPGTESAQRDFGDSDPCQVNVNCSEGNNWQDQKRGVVRIFIIEGQFAGWCSGSVVNNTAEDCTPYVLTALHCGINASTNNMNQWMFYFNYESSGCANGTAGQVPSNSMTGCARIADSGDGGGNNGSDYMLVELNNDIPGSYNPHYNGWRRNNVTSPSGVSIHHPSGDIKKISTYTSNLQTTNWGSAAGSHWLVVWSGTANGHGVTEGGSSGSPIFDNQGLIIGTLTGGSSYCNSVVPGGQTQPDLYGKMSYHWSSNPGDNLSQYLDPGNTGATSLNGSNDPCGSPGGGDDCVTNIPYPEDDPCVIVVIAADDYCCDTEWDDICEDAYVACSSVDECEAGTVSVATNQNVCPDETGIFDATGVSVPAGGGYAVQFVPDGGTGGNEVGFSITAVQPLPFEFDNDINGVLSSNGFPPLAGTWTVTGFAYTDPENAAASFCSITEVDVTVNFLSSVDPLCNGAGGDDNDDCANAILVAPGVHPFSTIGATTDGPDQPGSACDVFSQSNVNNDVWFEYTASCDGVSSFSTCNTADFDTRIAVYPAGQCPPTAASLIICNDDGDDCTEYTSYLEWPVAEGESYLLRIGGYSAADFGEGTFELIEDCGASGEECIADIPYPEDDPCVIVVIAEDDFCCETEWDNICEDAYVACSSGDECDAGTVSVATNQNICPDETGIFDATGVSIPAGGGYAVQFVPDGGTGGNEVGFSITEVQSLPFEFDSDINGIMSANGFPPLSGAWLVTGFAYTDPEDAGGSFCSITEIDVTVNFLAADHPSCGGSGGDDNDDCANAILVAPGVHPFSTIGATTDGPDQPGSDCDAFQQSNVNNDVWFEYTASCDGVSSFSTCNTADFDTRIAVYPAGQCPPTAASLIICNDDGDDCTEYTSYLEWPVAEGESYLLRIGGYSATDFGEGTFELIEDCAGDPVDPTNEESFEGDFPPACWSIIDADGDGQNWFKYGSDDPGNPLFGVAQDGFYTAASASWMGSPLTPNNYLVTPQLTLGSNEELVYWVAAQDPDWSAENYAVFLSTTGNAAANFTVNLFEETLINDTWVQRTIDLSAYAGQDVYLAFRHYNVTDEFYIKIDNVTLPGDIIPCVVEPPGEECMDWVEPSATTGWDNFNTEFEGAPANEGEGCPTYEITEFEVWMSEAYAMDNIVAGTSYTFSHCNGPGAGTWVPEYTIITPSGAVDAYGAGDGDGCSITWIASESGTYLIVINEAGNCGVDAQIDNGFPAITCNDQVTSIEETETTMAFQVFPNPNNGQFVVQLNGSGGLAQVDILEVSGKVVQSAQMNFAESTQYQVDLGGHASGMYFVRITMNDHMYVERVVIQ